MQIEVNVHLLCVARTFRKFGVLSVVLLIESVASQCCYPSDPSMSHYTLSCSPAFDVCALQAIAGRRRATTRVSPRAAAAVCRALGVCGARLMTLAARRRRPSQAAARAQTAGAPMLTSRRAAACRAARAASG